MLFILFYKIKIFSYSLHIKTNKQINSKMLKAQNNMAKPLSKLLFFFIKNTNIFYFIKILIKLKTK